MGLTRYHIATELLKEYVEKEKTNIIWTGELKSLMRRRLSDAGSFQALFALREEGVITEKELNKWEIHLTKQA